jgi:hypothetical protein
MSESVPFFINNLHGGFAIATGLVRFAEDLLRFEMRVEDSVFGVLKGQIKTVEIPLNRIEEVQFKPRRGPVKARLVIRVSDLGILERIPGKHGEIRLLFQSRHHQAAERLFSALQLRRSELELLRLQPDPVSG